MKSDLSTLMRERGLDALVISNPDGLAAVNAAFTYFVGAAHVTQGHIIVKAEAGLPSSEPLTLNLQPSTLLIHQPMERDEAARAGLRLHSLGGYDMRDILRAAGGDRLAAQVELMRRLFGDLGVSGRVGFYGVDQRGASFAFLNALAEAGFVEVVVEHENDVVSRARETKDAGEAALIRQTCRLTERVIGAAREFLRGHRAAGDMLVKPGGDPLTVGDVKAFVRVEQARLGLDDPGFIFSIGRDAGVPHSAGTASDVIRLGRAIIFDIFPRLPGGYHADITRTWCLGYAPDDIQRAYQDVLRVHDRAEAMFDARRPAWEYQEMACDLFEAAGHRTVRDGPGVTAGYAHSLGHGFGLAVHEPPTLRLKGLTGDEPLPPGAVITNEPGLYYPDLGWGVRVEDDYWLDPAGGVERLTEFDRDLVVPM
jgi:Xaa-Pro aminopeptidase